jgi:ribokinase
MAGSKQAARDFEPAGTGTMAAGEPMQASALDSAPCIIVVGSLNMDWVGRAPRLPGPGETVMGHGLQQFHGGKGGNQAVAAARLGARVAFHGAVGQDATGTELLSALAEQGITTQGVVRVAHPSGAALITVADNGENAITVLPGANLAAPMPGAVAWGGVQALLLQLEVPLATNLAWAQAAKAAQVPVALNAAPMAEGLTALLAAVDVLVVNQGELAVLLGGLEGGLPDALQRAHRMGPATVVVTLGAQGCMAWADGQCREVPVQPVKVVDTTGAGDTFAAALCVARARGLAWHPALAYANTAAALSCTQAGARSGMPAHAAVLAAMVN